MAREIKKADQLYAMRHSLAHVMAAAVQQLWPKAKFGVGPVIADGFYYDIDFGKDKVTDTDLAKIEEKMAELIRSGQEFVQSKKTITEALSWAQESNQPYKEELLKDLQSKGTTAVKDVEINEVVDKSVEKIASVTFYQNGEFVDLCRGPHISDSSELGVFKLDRIAGAYWRGNEENPQLTRIYGVAFDTKKELDNYVEKKKQAKERDHRLLGEKLKLFTFSELVGSGLPLFTPAGTALRDSLNEYSQQLRKKKGYQAVWTPHVTKRALYERSGHWDKFGDELFLVESQETNDELVLKPMNCPHHAQIYAASQRSYRDLPIKYLETATTYRDEKTGELLGLSRVRSITMDDSHVFCREDQIEDVISELIEITQQFYSNVGMPLRVRLSLRDDSDGYLGEKKLWESAQETLRKVSKQTGLDVYEVEGEAAFYGPKLDFMAVDSLGRKWQVATPQLDFIQPQRFGLEYTDKDGSTKTPVMIHFALLGSLERFLSVYIEHTGGNFPVWLAPEQVRVATVNDSKKVVNFANEVQEKLQESGLRSEIDTSNETVSKKIRHAEVMKVPYTLVIGDKEVTTGEFTPRVRSDMAVEHKNQVIKLEQFIETVVNETKSRVHHSSL